MEPLPQKEGWDVTFRTLLSLEAESTKVLCVIFKEEHHHDTNQSYFLEIRRQVIYVRIDF